MVRNPVPSQNNDGVLQILLSVEDDPRCCATWKREAIILNIADQKYTIGSGKDFEKVLSTVDHGQFLLFPDNTDVSKIQCQISCNAKGEFWLHNLEHYSEIFLNGKILEDFPVRLRFGDIFYFSPILSQFWNPNATGLLRVPNKSGTRPLTVFKFERHTSKNQYKRKKKTVSKISDTKPENGTLHFQKAETQCSRWDSNHVILSKIFDNLCPRDIFNCRLVSKSWNRSASHMLKTSFVANFKIDVIENPHGVAMRFHWFANRMQSLNFEKWQIKMRLNAYWNLFRDNEAKVVVKFKHDFSSFIAQEHFQIKSIEMSTDYLFPINQIVSRFCYTLEHVVIKINASWVADGGLEKFPGSVNFPKLKTLQLHCPYDFSSDEPFEWGEEPRENLSKVIESKWLKCFLTSVSGIEHLVLKNVAKIPAEFSNFKNLKSVTIHSETWYGVNKLELHESLEKLTRLPKDQLESFNLICCVTSVLDETVEESLPRFLESQKNSLEKLELTCPGLRIKLPCCMPNLKKLWISYEGGNEHVCGVTLPRQVTRIATGFDFYISNLPAVSINKCTCRKKACHHMKLSLVFGRLDLNQRQFVSYIPNVESIWAWDC